MKPWIFGMNLVNYLKKYKSKEIRQQWKSFKELNKSIGIICNYAKQYKIKFNKWNKQWNNDEFKYFDINTPILNKFDINDELDFYDFKDYLFDNKFESIEKAVDYISTNLYKVCAKVGDNIIIKLPKDDYKNINQIEQYNESWRKVCLINIEEQRPITLLNFLNLYPQVINKFKMMNTEFINDETKLNDKDFYISQCMLTKYINKDNRDEEKMKHWFNYIKEVICNNDEICYEYFNQWLGFIIIILMINLVKQ